MTLTSLTLAFHAVGSLLLVVSGVAKLVFPHPATRFLAGAGLTDRVSIARALGGAELAAGLVGLSVAGPIPAMTVAVTYTVFALVVLRAIGRGSASCGCFGRVDSPPSIVHAVGNLFFAAVSILAAGAGSSPAGLVAETAADRPGAAVALVVVVCLLAGLVFVFFTGLPELLRARSAARVGPATFQVGTAGNPPSTTGRGAPR